MHYIAFKTTKTIAPYMQGIEKTRACNHLFNTNPESKKSSEAQGQLFHHLVAI